MKKKILKMIMATLLCVLVIPGLGNNVVKAESATPSVESSVLAEVSKEDSSEVKESTTCNSPKTGVQKLITPLIIVVVVAAVAFAVLGKKGKKPEDKTEDKKDEK